MSTFAAVLSAAAMLLSAAPEGIKGTASDLARLQGCWTAQAGPKHNFRVTLEIEGNSARVHIVTPQGVTVRARGEVRVDDSVSPHALDWVHFQGVNDQELPDVLAIYELTGDTFRVCNGGPDNDRPTEFKPGDGLLATVVTFQRAKDAPTAESARPTAAAGQARR
jgi:uncharacterized protein (TIGR03067 family)